MKFGIIGYGNLGKALVKGLLYTGIPQEDVIVNARTEKTLNSVKTSFEHIITTESKKELVDKADVIILVVEPKNASDVLNEISRYNICDKIIISFMAGITIADIRQMLDKNEKDVNIVRIMPNIAIANGNGILGVTYEDSNCRNLKEVINIFDKLGYMIKLEESQLDYITVTAASGLAFAASIMNMYQKACNTLFNDEIQSKEITLRVFENVIDMIKDENSSFDNIINQITTKGGTTEAGMNSLKQDMILENLQECIFKSYEKCKKII